MLKFHETDRPSFVELAKVVAAKQAKLGIPGAETMLKSGSNFNQIGHIN